MVGDRYLFISGLKRVAEEMQGDEVVHAGARPYGLHAGNRLPLVVYPLLLAQALQDLGKVPRFQYTVTLNDWESDQLETLPGHPLNFVPRGRSFQFQPDPFGCCATLVDHWEGQFWRELSPIRQAFPTVSISIVRASQLRDRPAFLETVRQGLTQAPVLARELMETVGVDILTEKAQLVGAVCPQCRSIQGQTQVVAPGDRVRFACEECAEVSEGELGAFDYWLYVHLLGAAKYLALRPNVWIFGGDFIQYRTVDFLDRMVQRLSGEPSAMKHLFTPILLGSDGEKMSKSLGNLLEVPLEWLVEQARAWNEMWLPPPAAIDMEV